MRYHIDALFTHDAQNQLVVVNEPSGTPAPRFFLGQTSDGPLWRFRHDVDHESRTALESVVQHLAIATLGTPLDPTAFAAILGQSATIEKTELGPAYTFPEQLAASPAVRVTTDNAALLRPLLAPWLPDVAIGQPMFAAVVDGHAVSVCCSVRLTDDAYEAGVETVPDYRGRGYAAQVAAAWACEVRAMGRVPLYSTSWQNTASQAVARKLGLIQFGNDLHIT